MREISKETAYFIFENESSPNESLYAGNNEKQIPIIRSNYSPYPLQDFNEKISSARKLLGLKRLNYYDAIPDNI